MSVTRTPGNKLAVVPATAWSLIQSVKLLLAAALTVTGALGSVQTDRPIGTSPSTWTGQRIVMLHGFGQVHHTDGDRARTAVGINLVTPVVRVDGNRIWVSSTGGDESGWLDIHDALLLSDAIAYFTAKIEQDAN